MPIYEYRCQKCKFDFEKLQGFSDSPVQKCPKCGAKVVKVINAPEIVFKGKGFYKTDSLKTSGKKETKSSKDTVTVPEVKKDKSKSSDKKDKKK